MSHTITRLSTCVWLGISMAFVVACNNASTPIQNTQLEKEIANFRYSLPTFPATPVQLSDGNFLDSESGISAELIGWARSRKGEKATDIAAVVIATNTGGSGISHDLVVMKIGGDYKLAQAASINFGGRLVLQKIEMKNGVVSLTYLGHAEDDPQCCPSETMYRDYRFRGDVLELGASSRN